jgi:hypothetical protein
MKKYDAREGYSTISVRDSTTCIVTRFPHSSLDLDSQAVWEMAVSQQQMLLLTFHILTSYLFIRDRLYIVYKFSAQSLVRESLGN